jgi:hypothetical protein
MRGRVIAKGHVSTMKTNEEEVAGIVLSSVVPVVQQGDAFIQVTAKMARFQAEMRSLPYGGG